MRIDVHYFRYDQNYDGWDLWLWPKGKEGFAYPFTRALPPPKHSNLSMQVAEVVIPELLVPEVGFLLRRNGWAERDWASDRYINTVDLPDGKAPAIYLVQNTEQIYFKSSHISFIPTAERALFRNYREIFVRLQSPCLDNDKSPFMVMGNDMPKKVIRTESLDNGSSFLLTLQADWIIGEACQVFKQGYAPFYVQYGALYNTAAFERRYSYEGEDLGCRLSENETSFRIWTPTASDVAINLYEGRDDALPSRVLPLSKDVGGTWLLRLPEDLSGWHYTYSVTHGGNLQDVCDPNAIGATPNGERALIARPSDADPPGWDKVGHIVPKNPNDAILYEVHIRDFTIHPESGIENKGKFLGLAEEGTTGPDGTKTGLDHLAELGITHVHLMPIFDFFTIDESRLHEGRFNWGYDPHLYNTPEGSYTTNPSDGLSRIGELKEMIMALKNKGIGVVMDVVYNHTYRSIDSEFNKLVPGYYYRMDEFGGFSDGSGCGNETASERLMVRKTIIDSVLYWAKEYKIDGFRFDLMALHDIDTMLEIRRALDNHHRGLLIYGEGWTGSGSALDSSHSAAKMNASRLPRIGFFNDSTRDAIKGDNFQSSGGGFVNGSVSLREGVMFGVVGAIPHPQIDSRRAVGTSAWAGYPWHCVNYAASHDNLTLFDKLSASRCAATDQEAMKRTNLAGSIVLLAQGIPFILSGTEFLRSKQGMHNSYNMPDEINRIDWSRKRLFRTSFDYHAGLIKLRKAHSAFRLTDPEEVRMKLSFLHTSDSVLAFMLRDHAGRDTWKNILVVFNAGNNAETVTLPQQASWAVVADDSTAGTDTIYTVDGSDISAPQLSCLVAWS